MLNIYICTIVQSSKGQGWAVGWMSQYLQPVALQIVVLPYLWDSCHVMHLHYSTPCHSFFSSSSSSTLCLFVCLCMRSLHENCCCFNLDIVQYFCFCTGILFLKFVVWSTEHAFRHLIYKGCPKINASYFVMLDHDVRGGCWWYGSRGWTFPASISLNFVTMWQMTAEGQSDKMASDMEMRMKQRCVIEFLHAEKIAPNDIHWRLVNVYGDQTVDVSTVRWWVACFSSGDSDMKDKQRSGCSAQLSHHEMKSISISSSVQIGGLQLGYCVRSWILASVCWKQWWHRWNIAKFTPDGSHKCSNRNRTPYASLLGPIEPIWGWRWQFPGLHHHWWRDVVSPVRAGVKMAVCGVATCEFPIEEKV